MILSVTFSKPVKNISQILGLDYTRVKAKLSVSSNNNDCTQYFVEFYTQTQVFHKTFSQEELDDFIINHAGSTFKNCIQITDTEQITILANKKGKISRLTKKLTPPATTSNTTSLSFKNITLTNGVNSSNKKKNYILKEGTTIPFLTMLGIMTADGKIINAKYDKFRQINRFLELLNDVLDDVIAQSLKGDPLTIVDFGSGKSYLTFAVQYFLTNIKNIPCQIFGLDLKKDIIDYCSSLADKLNLKNISFATGDIARFEKLKNKPQKNPDIIITLHACDTATDYALCYAIKHNAKAILSVPCCQHEINLQLKKSSSDEKIIEPLLKYGIIKERFSALLTDTIRAELLEQCGYKTQILEFIDENASPKNLMIRAVLNTQKEKKNDFSSIETIASELGINQTLLNLLTK